VIHETAIIDPSAKIAEGVSIGPWTYIGPNVEIGEGTIIHSHVVMKGPLRIGAYNEFFQFSSIGEISQDKKFDGEITYLEIGDRNIFREFCTVHRGTAHGSGVTSIGSDNLLMAYSHIAHDCSVGNHTVFMNNASLAGHVTVEDYAILGGFCGVHQFCRIGTHAFVSATAGVEKDIPPYIKVFGNVAAPCGLNTVGLRRKEFSYDTIAKLKQAYKIIYQKNNTIKEAVVELEELSKDCEEVNNLKSFIKNSSRGIVRFRNPEREDMRFRNLEQEETTV
jgi:UDP-N-acetylglucosamine acyltransferase